MVAVHQEKWTVSSTPIRERVYDHLYGRQIVYPPAQICDVCHQATKRLGYYCIHPLNLALALRMVCCPESSASCLAASRSHATIYLQTGHPDRCGLPEELHVSLTTCCQYNRLAASPAVVVFLHGIKCTILVARSTTVIMESSPSAAAGKSVKSRRLLLAIWLLV